MNAGAAKYFGRSLAAAVSVRVACAALTGASVLILTRRLEAADRNVWLGVSLVRLPLLQTLIAFPAREVASRTAARSASVGGGVSAGSSQPAMDAAPRGAGGESAPSVAVESRERAVEVQQSSFNLTYFGVLTSCLVAIFLVPLWLSVLAVRVCQEGGVFGAGRVYECSVFLTAIAGILEAASEPLAIKAQFMQMPHLRTTAEAVSWIVRSVLSTLLLLASDAKDASGQTLAAVVFHPLAAKAFSSAVGALAALCVLVHSTRTTRFEQGALLQTEERRVWPPFRRLTGLSSIANGRDARSSSAQRRRDLRAFVHAGHLDLLSVNLKLMAHKLVINQGETALMLLLLGESAAGVYGLVSNSASLVCRVVFAPSEASAFSAFCALQKEQLSPSQAFLSEGDGLCESRWVSPSERPAQAPLPFAASILTRRLPRASGEEGVAVVGASVETEAERVLRQADSEGMALGRGAASSAPRPKPGSSRATSLLQLSLLLQGVVGMGVVAAGCIFPQSLLRLCFGPSTVTPEAAFVPTLQAFSGYMFLLSLIGPLDAYLTARASSATLRILNRRTSWASGMHFFVLLPTLTRTPLAMILGGPSVGAALSQLLTAGLRLAVRLQLVFMEAQEQSAATDEGAASAEGVSGGGGRRGKVAAKGTWSLRGLQSQQLLDIARGAALAFPEETPLLLLRFLEVCLAAVLACWLLRRNALPNAAGCLSKELHRTSDQRQQHDREAAEGYAAQILCLQEVALPLWIAELALGLCAAAGGIFGIWQPFWRNSRRIMGEMVGEQNDQEM